MKNSKHTDVLNHLREHGSITSDEAWREYGATRLSAIVFNLRRRGHDISTELQHGVDRNGRPISYAKYVYSAPEQES